MDNFDEKESFTKFDLEFHVLHCDSSEFKYIIENFDMYEYFNGFEKYT